MTNLEIALVAGLMLGAFWAWQNWPAISFALSHPTVVTGGSELVSGLSGLGVLS